MQGRFNTDLEVFILSEVSQTEKDKYADDTTVMAESEELKNLSMKVKEECEKVGLKLTFRKLRSWNPVPSLHDK